MKTTIVILTLSALLPSISATAAPETSATNTPIVLPEVTVKGTPAQGSLTSPSEADAEAIKTQVPGGFTLRDTRELFQARASSFEDFLGGIPGVTLQSENEMEVSKISIRGSGILSEDEPLGVNFLLDGFTFNQGDGEVILEDLDIGSIKYAEVYRGASAFKYGSQTLGGAVNLVSITGYDADPLRIRLAGGSYGFVQSQISTGGVEGPVDYYVSVTGRSRDGYREHSAENTELLTANFGYKFSTNSENRFFMTVDRTDRLLPGGLTKDEMNANPRQTDPDAPSPGATPYAISQDYNKDWYYLRLADKVSFNNGPVQADAGVFWWHRNIQEKGPSNDEGTGGIQDFFADNIGLTLNLTLQTELFHQRNILTAGFTPNVEREVDQNFINVAGQHGATTAHDAELSVNGPLFLENQHYLTEKLSLVTGIQANYAQRHFSDYYFHPETSMNIVFRGVSPKLGMIYEFNETNQIFANLSEAWQAPSFDNMVDFDSAPDVDVTPLVPQRAWTVEIGTRGEYGRAAWDLAFYHSWVHNELLELNDAAGVDIGAFNVSRSMHQGIEAGLELDLWDSIFAKKKHDRAADRLSLDQTFTLNDFHFDNDPTYGNNRIAGLPIYLYEAQLKYTSPCGFYAGPTFEWNITKYPVDHENTLFADAYALLGFRMGYESKKGFSVFFEAKNLTDKTYASSVDPIPSAQYAANGPYTVFHPADGRTFYGGVSYKW